LPKGESIKSLPRHERTVYTLAMSPNGKVLASINGDMVRLWSLPEGKALHEGILVGSFGAQALSPDGKLLAVANAENIKLWSIPEGKPGRTLKGIGTPVVALAFLPEGNDNLLAVNLQGEVMFWNPSTGERRPVQVN